MQKIITLEENYSEVKKILFLINFGLFLFLAKGQSIYNAYAKVTSITSGTLLNVSNVNQVNHAFNVNEFVIVMQMQDDVIGANTTTNSATFGNLSAINNAGRFEVARITAVNLSAGTPTSIGLASALVNPYNTGANSSVQVITFRRLSATAFTSTNSITGLAWNGNVGGVIALEIPTVFTLAHNITANGLGFLGGVKNTPNAYSSCDATSYARALGNRWAGKGEGIYKNTNSAWAAARGKILTGGGGGNDVNAGGGGGGNFTAGGNGGAGWVPAGTGCSPVVGGLGGISLSAHINPSRVFMGGGGGGGHENDGVGTVGGRGGGILLLKTGTLTTGACAGISITANGVAAANCANDGAGGGGAAGSMVFQINTWNVAGACPLTITASGGNGGNSNVGVGGTHGGGGGGGQGAIIFSIPQPTANITTSTTPGTGGTSCSGCAVAVNGSAGVGPNNAGIIVNSSGVLPIELINFSAENQDTKVALNWATAAEKNTNYFYIERSSDGLNWQKISEVKAAENSQTILYYETNDLEPLYDISYYRLKIIDLDKSYTYSPIKSTYRTKKEAFVIFYPNPTLGVLNLSSSYANSQIKYKIFDITGKELSVNIINQSEDKITFDFSNLAKGLYFINVTAPDGTEFSSNRIILK
ncbi:MAG: T9SS type A sorting domain-containing protein [Bacteroidota bacterium]|nr:T9SS type A sorting domain-containing protein [Bacteroidota bacterium]